MAESAALLVDDVLPHQPIRQWVLSFPFPLRLSVRKIKRTTDYAKYINYVEDRPFNDKRYYIDNNKLLKLGWNIEVNFNDGIDDLINHYQ